MSQLILQNINKWFDKDVHAIKNVNLVIERGEFVVFVGPSGCGKSTILRMIAGLERTSTGEIRLNGKSLNDIPTRKRDISMVFQHYALYPHFTVYQNLSFSLKIKRLPKSEINRLVKLAANSLQIEQFLNRKPEELSGGQRQRVAIARAIIQKAKLLLLDEPLSNLDAQLRTEMRTMISNLYNELKTTFIYVTHDQIEAMTMATTLVVMKDGEIQQIGTPMAVYKRPKNTFVGQFIGSPSMNFFRGKILDNLLHIGKTAISIPQSKQTLFSNKGYINQEIIVGVRPEHFYEVPKDRDNAIQAEVVKIDTLGSESIVHLLFERQPLTIKSYTHNYFPTNKQLKLAFNIENAHFFDCQTENRIL